MQKAYVLSYTTIPSSTFHLIKHLLTRLLGTFEDALPRLARLLVCMWKQQEVRVDYDSESDLVVVLPLPTRGTFL